MYNDNDGSFTSWVSLVSKWLAVMTLAWTINLLAVGGVSIHSWAEWQALVVSYFLNGVLIGTIVGLGQALVFGSQQVSWLKLTLVTMAGDAVGFPPGLGLTSAIGFWTWPAGVPMMAGLSGTTMRIDLSNVAPLAGGVIGLGQWLVLRGRILPATLRGALLWVLGNIFGLAAGGLFARVVDGLTWLGYFPLPMGTIIARVVVGA